MAQHMINLPCIADTYIDDDNPSTNYGNATSLLAGIRRVLPPTGGDYVYFKRALLKFDISSIRYKRIISAYLRIYITEVFQSTGGTISVNTKNIDFDEYGATAQNTNFGVPYHPVRALSQTSTGYQEFDTISDSALYPTCVVDVHGTGYEYYPYIRFSSRETANPPELKVTYEDVPPGKPNPIAPVGIFKDGRSTIRFEWEYVSSVGGEQKKFDLQWSTNQSDWTTVSETTANTYYDMPAGTLQAGNIYWRVRTYNEYDEVSEYSDVAAFYCIGAPDAPVIQSVSSSCRPLIEWTAFDQQVYQIQIMKDEDIIYDSGTVPSMSARSHQVSVFIDDGEYTARMRVKNEYDLWSEWGTYNFTIANTKPAKPTLTIQRTKYGLELMSGGTYEEVYVYRDEICIGKAENGIYHDNTCANGKEYAYFVRGVVGDAFEDSKIVLAAASFTYGLLSDGDDIIELKYNISTTPGKNTISNQVGTANYYDGRKYPVFSHTEHVDESLSLTYFLKDYTDVERLEAMADRKGIVLYRDKRGRKLYGTLTGVNVQDVRQGFIVMFTILATDCSEAILP
jgi:hypothetical protein